MRVLASGHVFFLETFFLYNDRNMLPPDACLSNEIMTDVSSSILCFAQFISFSAQLFSYPLHVE